MITLSTTKYRNIVSLCKVRQPFTIAKRFYPLKPPKGYKPTLPNSNVPPVNPNSKVPPANPNSIKPTTPPKESTPVTKKEPLPSYTPPKQPSTNMNSIMDNPYVKAKVKANSKSSGDAEHFLDKEAQLFKDSMNNPKMTVENSINTCGLNATEFFAKHGIKPPLVGNTLISNDPLPPNPFLETSTSSTPLDSPMETSTSSVNFRVPMCIPTQVTPPVSTHNAKREAVSAKQNAAMNMPQNPHTFYVDGDGVSYINLRGAPIPPLMPPSKSITKEPLEEARLAMKSNNNNADSHKNNITPSTKNVNTVDSHSTMENIYEMLMLSSSGLPVFSIIYFGHEAKVRDAYVAIIKNTLAQKEFETLNELIKRDLVRLREKYGYLPNERYRAIEAKISAMKKVASEAISFTKKDLIDQFDPHICHLNVAENNIIVTMFLSPLQAHYGIYHIINGRKIYTQYLTSDQDGKNVFLSPYQVFNDDPKKNKKPQLMYSVSPVVITDKDMIPLDKETEARAKEYFDKPEIRKKVWEEYQNKTIPQIMGKNTTEIYEAKGTTIEDNLLVIDASDKQDFADATKTFKKNYVHSIKLDQEHAAKGKASNFVEKFLLDTKTKKRPQYKYVIQLINEHNKKNNIPVQYEV